MIELRLFGQVEVRDEKGGIDLASAKLTALLAVLAVSSDKPVSRETLTDLLWGSHFDEQARQNFRQALSRLRKLLGADALIADDQTVKLDRRHVSADIIRFDALKNASDASGLAAAAELARGEFLEGLAIREPAFTEWLALERKRLLGDRRRIRSRLATIALAANDAALALSHAEAMLRHDAFDEEAHRYKLQALATLGRKAEALKDHQAFAALLKSELGTGPEPATMNLVVALKTSTPSNAAASDGARPSIAVMPFANLSPDPEQSYFADAMADELITALSRLPWLTVMSRGATFAFKDKPIDARQAGQEFSVRYVIEGSVRKAGSMVRITGQLIDTETGVTIWGAHFDGSLEKVFEFQDQVTAKVLGAIQPRLERAELARSHRKPTTSLDAYDYYLRGLAEVHRWTQDGNREALRHFYRAIELDRRFGAAYGMAARCLSQRKTNGWVEDEAREKAEAEGLANLAVEFGRDDPVALAAAGIATAFVVCKVHQGGELIERALAINPGYAVAWMFRGWVKSWAGEADEAMASINRAIELSPYDPDPYVVSMRRTTAFVHFIAGRYEEALVCTALYAALPQNATTSTAAAAASAALLGRMDVAKKAMAHLLLADPRLSQARLRSRFPIVRDEDFNRLADALRLAGLPE